MQQNSSGREARPHHQLLLVLGLVLHGPAGHSPVEGEGGGPGSGEIHQELGAGPRLAPPDLIRSVRVDKLWHEVEDPVTGLRTTGANNAVRDGLRAGDDPRVLVGQELAARAEEHQA